MVEQMAGSGLPRTRRGRRLSPLLAHGLLASGSLAVVILVIAGAELLARHWAPDYVVRARGLHVFSRIYGWSGRPDAVAPMGSGLVRLNARGYRGRDLGLSKRNGQTRVVVLGDSIAFGFGVSDERTFAHLLDVRDNGIEAGNLAVAGYGPGQELLVLQRDGLEADPDVVVLAVCLRNDFVDAILPVALYDGITPRPRFRLVDESLVLDESAMPRSYAGRFLRRLGDDSHLLNRLLAALPRGEAASGPDWRFRKREALSDADYAFRLSFALVMEMRALCSRHGVELLVASFPSGLSYEMKTPLPERFLGALKAEGLWVVDMNARFGALGETPARLALDKTGHLSPRGHALSSEILEREIASRVAGRRGPGAAPTSAQRLRRVAE